MLARAQFPMHARHKGAVARARLTHAGLCAYSTNLTASRASLPLPLRMFTFVARSLLLLHRSASFSCACACLRAIFISFSFFSYFSARAGECVSAGDALTIPSRCSTPPTPTTTTPSPARQERAYIRRGQK